MFPSLTGAEKKVIGFFLGLLTVGSGTMLFKKGKPEPLFKDSYHSVEATAKNDSLSTGSLAIAVTSDGSIDINTANADLLASIPGIGPSLAGAIISYRTTNGAYKTVDELDGVKGIGPSKLAAIRKYVNVAGGGTTLTLAQTQQAAAGVMPSAPNMLMGNAAITPAPSVQKISPQPIQAASQVASAPPPTRVTASAIQQAPAAKASASGVVNINTASQSELETLHRIGPALAKRIIEHRQLHGAFANVNALEDVKGIGPKILDDNRARLTVR